MLAISCVWCEPVHLIFDTDVGNDIDDALALAVLHALADRGEVDLLAVTVSKDNPWSAAYVDAVNIFYGRPHLPIGLVRHGKTPRPGRFVRPVAEQFPFDLDLDHIPAATEVLRRTLSAQPDRSVVIVSVGFLTNLACLLDEPGGMELVRRKVRLYVMMGGNFASGKPEYNFYTDPGATARVLRDWPTPLVATGYEVGEAVLYPATSIEHDFGWTPHHPVAEAYRRFAKMPYDRPTWDLTAVLYAVRPERGYFNVSPPGTITFHKDHTTTFEPGPGGRHRYLSVSREQKARLAEAFALLASSPR